ncbi:GNAT family N-acetyltransferase [Actinomadura kijaniata]|uniref:GNAT family N-acetyltransferase n=1 Tax=Actinomadura kijaniata TaxID=46161 RepID=UPI000B2A2C56|nr:GNAT family N-acetyltransferase [Actinomadura kijaniata]
METDHPETARPPERIVLPRTAPPVVLRRMTEADAEAVHEAVTESFPHLHAWMDWAAEPPTLAGQVEFLRHSVREWEQGSQCDYGMFGPDGTMLGAAALADRGEPGTREIGYWVRTDHTRRGLATAAAGALTAEAFGLPGVERTEIRCDEANTASAGVSRKLGYRLDRVVDRPVKTPRETGRGLVWVMTREAFTARG